MVVTGATGGVARALLARLAVDPPGPLVGLDATPHGEADPVALPEAVDVRRLDVRDPALVPLLRALGAPVVVHLDTNTALERPAAERRALNVDGTAAVLAAAREAGAARVLLVTSATVYGARADNPVPLLDAAPLRAEESDAVHGDHVAVERLAQQAAAAGLAVTVLRPATLVGPGVDDPTARALEAPRLLLVRGSHPAWQFCHVDDLATALELAVRRPLPGAYAVAGDGWLGLADVERITGKRHLELPLSVAQTTAERLHVLGLAAPPGELAYSVYPWVVAADGLRAAAWRPAWDNSAALLAHVDSSRSTGRGARTASRAAAGATVLVGTAALIRRARRRRLR